MARKAPGKATAGPTKTAGGRTNPRHRRTNIWEQVDYVLGKDPDKHYVLVNPTDESAMADYRFKGYEEVLADPAGVRPAMGATVRTGEVIMIKGQMLMAIDKSVLEEEQAERMLHVNARMDMVRRGEGQGRALSNQDMRQMGIGREFTEYQEA